jgi:hypothetical protein
MNKVKISKYLTEKLTKKRIEKWLILIWFLIAINV